MLELDLFISHERLQFRFKTADRLVRCAVVLVGQDPDVDLSVIGNFRDKRLLPQDLTRQFLRRRLAGVLRASACAERHAARAQ